MNDADKAYQAVQKQTKTLTTVKGKKKKSRDFHGTCKKGPKKRGGGGKTPTGREKETLREEVRGRRRRRLGEEKEKRR
jgi:hypothetical protein